MTFGIDTNILVRHYTQDDPVQSPLATRFLERCCTEENPGWISLIVVCELSWVLRKGRKYKYSKQKLVEVLFAMRHTRGFGIEDENSFDQALHLYENSDADFADCLIGIRNHIAGANITATFDEGAAKLPGFELLADRQEHEQDSDIPQLT